VDVDSTTPWLNDDFQDARYVITDRVVEWCTLTALKPVMKAPMDSALALEASI
jgi:hypothetical protein